MDTPTQLHVQAHTSVVSAPHLSAAASARTRARATATPAATKSLLFLRAAASSLSGTVSRKHSFIAKSALCAWLGSSANIVTLPVVAASSCPVRL